jgi:hypothetical protein
MLTTQRLEPKIDYRRRRLFSAVEISSVAISAHIITKDIFATE